MHIWFVIIIFIIILNVCFSTKRPKSPPPLHLSPAAPSLLLPLITARDNPSLSESDRIAASSQLTAALSCLVDQLGGFVSDDEVQDENRAPSTENCHQVYTDENEDDRSGFNNIVHGALIDLEVLIQGKFYFIFCLLLS